MSEPLPLRLIPGDLTEKPLPSTAAAAWEPEGDGLDGRACQRTPWAHQRIKAMGAWRTPRHPGVPETSARLEVVGAPGHIPGGERTGGHRQRGAYRPTRWAHIRPPDTVHRMQEERRACLRSCQLETACLPRRRVRS